MQGNRGYWNILCFFIVAILIGQMDIASGNQNNQEIRKACWVGETAVLFTFHYEAPYIQLVWKMNGRFLINCVRGDECHTSLGKTEGNITAVINESSFSRTSGQLRINNVRLEDEGTYSLEPTLIGLVANPISSQLVVLVRPHTLNLLDESGGSFNAASKNIVLDEGGVSRIGCHAIGSKPRANITWYLDGAVISDVIVTVNTSTNPDDGRLSDTLSWVEIRREDGRNNLTCRATMFRNTVAESSVILDVQVHTDETTGKYPSTILRHHYIPALTTLPSQGQDYEDKCDEPPRITSFQVKEEATKYPSLLVTYSVRPPHSAKGTSLPATQCFLYVCESWKKLDVEQCRKEVLPKSEDNEPVEHLVTDLAVATFDLHILCHNEKCGNDTQEKRISTYLKIPESSNNTRIRDLIFVIVAAIVVSTFVIIVTVTVILRVIVKGTAPKSINVCEAQPPPGYLPQPYSLSRSGSFNLYTIKEGNEGEDKIYQEIKDRLEPSVTNTPDLIRSQSFAYPSRSKFSAGAGYRARSFFSPQTNRASKLPPLPPVPHSTSEPNLSVSKQVGTKTETQPGTGIGTGIGTGTDTAVKNDNRSSDESGQTEGEYMRMDSVIIEDIDVSKFVESLP